MVLSPQDIVDHEFKQSLRGYAVREVDDLLDRLADQVERADRDLAELRGRLRDTEERLSEALATESSLKRTLITAQDTAQRTIDDADQQASELLEDARARSARMLEEAEAEAAALRASFSSEREAATARIVELANIENRYRAQLRAQLEEHLAALEEIEAGGVPGGSDVDELRRAAPQPSDRDGGSSEDGHGAEAQGPDEHGADGQDGVGVAARADDAGVAERDGDAGP